MALPKPSPLRFSNERPAGQLGCRKKRERSSGTASSGATIRIGWVDENSYRVPVAGPITTNGLVSKYCTGTTQVPDVSSGLFVEGTGDEFRRF